MVRWNSCLQVIHERKISPPQHKRWQGSSLSSRFYDVGDWEDGADDAQIELYEENVRNYL